MAGEKFDVGKLLRGFNIFNGAIFGKVIWNVSITLIVLAIIAGVWYKLFGQRTEATHQTAEQITNIEKGSDGFRVLGIELFGWRN